MKRRAIAGDTGSARSVTGWSCGEGVAGRGFFRTRLISQVKSVDWMELIIDCDEDA